MEKRRKIEDVCVFLISIVLTIIFLLISPKFIQFPGIVGKIFFGFIFLFMTAVVILSGFRMFRKTNKKNVVYFLYIVDVFATIISFMFAFGGISQNTKKIAYFAFVFSFLGMVIFLWILQKYEDET